MPLFWILFSKIPKSDKNHLQKLGQNYKLDLKLGFNNIQCSKWNHTSNLYAKTYNNY